MNDLLRLIIGIGIVQAIVVGAYLFFGSRSTQAEFRTMALLLLLSALLMSTEILELFEWTRHLEPLVLQSAITFDLILASLVWFLVQFLLGKKVAYRWKDSIHGLPFLAGLAWYLTGFQWYGIERPGSFSHIPDAIAFFVFAKGILLFAYGFAAAREVHLAPDLENEPLQRDRWKLARLLTWSFLIILVANYAAFWLMYFGHRLPIDSDYLGCILITTLVYILTYQLLKTPVLSHSVQPLLRRPKYYKSTIDQQQRLLHLEKLQAYLKTEKPFLDQKISLGDLAEALELSSNTLSQVINESLNQNFHDLLNDFRLQEVKKKLSDPSQNHKTILALAFESGFQSKASFNRIFKKTEGATPSEFRKQQSSGLILPSKSTEV